MRTLYVTVYRYKIGINTSIISRLNIRELYIKPIYL